MLYYMAAFDVGEPQRCPLCQNRFDCCACCGDHGVNCIKIGLALEGMSIVVKIDLTALHVVETMRSAVSKKD